MNNSKRRLFPASFRALLSLGALVFLLASACASAPLVPAEAPPPSVTGIISLADKYGNVLTDISAEALAAAGFELGDMLRLEAGTFNGELPLVNAYADVQRGEPLVRISDGFTQLSISYGNFAEKNTAGEGTPVTLTLTAKGTYKTQLELRKLTRTEDRADYSSDAVFANFREVRTTGIPANILYRSCHPALGDARAPFAARLAEGAGIAAVVNLADTPEELVQHAALVPWYQSLVSRGSVVTLGMGVDYTSPDFSAKLKTGLEFMLNHNPPYLVHCNEGKDRAGVTAALLSALMGASPDEIVDDYMQSYVNYYGFVKGEERYAAVSQIMRDILKDFNGGTEPRAGETSAAAENYLRNKVGFSPAQISALKRKLAAR